jgi:hypothetical protein
VFSFNPILIYSCIYLKIATRNNLIATVFDIAPSAQYIVDTSVSYLCMNETSTNIITVTSSLDELSTDQLAQRGSNEL